MFGKEASHIDNGDELCFMYQTFSDEKDQRYRVIMKKVKNKIGMVKLLNSLFDCQNTKLTKHETLFSKWLNYCLNK